MLAFLDRDKARQRADDEKAQQLQQLPEPVRRWFQALEADGRKSVASIRKATAQQRQPLEAQAAAVQAVIDKMVNELAEAQQWLGAIPAEAEPSHVTEKLTIKTLWPQRIQEQRDKLAEIRQQLAEVQRHANIAANEVRAGVNLQIGEVAKALPHIRIVLEE